MKLKTYGTHVTISKEIWDAQDKPTFGEWMKAYHEAHQREMREAMRRWLNVSEDDLIEIDMAEANERKMK